MNVSVPKIKASMKVLFHSQRLNSNVIYAVLDVRDVKINKPVPSANEAAILKKVNACHAMLIVSYAVILNHAIYVMLAIIFSILMESNFA